MSDVLKRGMEIAESIGLTRADSRDYITWSEGQCGRGEPAYMANQIWQLLGESVDIGFELDRLNYVNFTSVSRNSDGTWNGGIRLCDTHKALLIAIKPIKVESDERKLLKELLGLLMPNDERGDFAFADARMEKRNSIIERAKELLGRE